MSKFQECYEDHGGGNGLYLRNLSPGRYHFVEIECALWLDHPADIGLDYLNEEDETDDVVPYYCQLAEVDTWAVGNHVLHEAKESCSWDGMSDTEDDIAQCVYHYGAKATLWEEYGWDFDALVKEAKKRSTDMSSGPAYEKKVASPANALGSTQYELMQGDLQSALVRGVNRGDPATLIMAKIQGFHSNIEEISVWATYNLQLIPSDDPLPYLLGYRSAMNNEVLNQSKKWRAELAPSYVDGYRMGVDVKSGYAPPPEWIIAKL